MPLQTECRGKAWAVSARIKIGAEQNRPVARRCRQRISIDGAIDCIAISRFPSLICGVVIHRIGLPPVTPIMVPDT